jgi:hypothetical protein
MPVEFELKSLDGKVTHNVSAFTTEKVTGDMQVIDWNEYAGRWDHLKIFERTPNLETGMQRSYLQPSQP